MEEELTRILKDLVYATGGNSDSQDEECGITIAICEIEAIFTYPKERRAVNEDIKETLKYHYTY